MTASNLVSGDAPREFYVWVDPTDFLVRHNIEVAGAFVSALADPSHPKLMFLPNPEFEGFVSPFQSNLLRAYLAEYNLEVSRGSQFPDYPPRLQAMFLLDSPADARNYARHHPEHVGGRVLKRGRTSGEYSYSSHDAAWVDFLRSGGWNDDQTLQLVGGAYWRGDRVADYQLSSMGEPWSSEPIPEVLFMGRLDFDDRSLAG